MQLELRIGNVAREHRVTYPRARFGRDPERQIVDHMAAVAAGELRREVDPSRSVGLRAVFDRRGACSMTIRKAGAADFEFEPVLVYTP